MSLSASAIQATQENTDAANNSNATNNAIDKDEENSKDNENSKEEVAVKKVEFKDEKTPREDEDNIKDEDKKKDDEKVEEKKEKVEVGEEEEVHKDEEEAEEDEDDEGLGEERDPEEQEKSEDEKPPEPISIDLNLMKSLYKFRDRPTLPYLLTEYGMEDKDAPPLKPKHKKKKKRKTFGDDAARDKERDKQQEEKHLQIVNDMTKLRDYYYDEYSTLLQNKVQKQRSRIRQYNLAMQAKLNEEEEKVFEVYIHQQRQLSHVKRKLDRHEFISDDSFLHDIPKSDLYHIVELQDKLIRDGTLRNQSDLSNFWERIQQPEIFYMYFNVPKSDDPDRKMKEDFNDSASSKANSTLRGSRASSVRSMQLQQLDPGSSHLDKKMGPRALSRINESRENSRPGTRLGQHWAITQQFPAQQKPEKRRTSFTGLTKPAPQQKSSYIFELEKRFPKLEMPKLHCFTMSLGPKPPDAEEVRHNTQLRQMEQKRKKYTYKLTRMHQMAMTNAAATSRILEMHEDMDFIINGAPLTDLISDHFFYSGLPPSSTEKPEPAEQLPTCSSPIPGASPQPEILAPVIEQDEALSTISSAQHSRRSSKSSKMSGKRKKGKSPKPVAEVQPPPKTVTPLSLDGVIDNSRIVTPKCMSTLWTNYTKDVPPATAAST